MQICIPIRDDQGLSSQVSDHFGSAVQFMIVDTDTGACRAILNHHRHHGHGMCQPLAALGDQDIDGIVVGGIGRHALRRLMDEHVRVYQAEHATVGETLDAFKAGSLRPMSSGDACAGHHHGDE